MPFDRKKYPKDWPAISKRIRDRAGQRCEECGIDNHALGYRTPVGGFIKAHPEDLVAQERKYIKIVLTVAHMNHDPMDCRDENLKALCQRCHLLYDGPLHRRNASHTRELKKTHRGQKTLEM